MKVNQYEFYEYFSAVCLFNSRTESLTGQCMRIIYFTIKVTNLVSKKYLKRGYDVSCQIHVGNKSLTPINKVYLDGTFGSADL